MGRHKEQDLYDYRFLPADELQLICFRDAPQRRICHICYLLLAHGGVRPLLLGDIHPLLQSNFEAKYLGRVLSLSSSIRLISGPVGLSLSGLFAEAYGVEKWFLIAGALVLLAAFLCLAVPAVRGCDDGGNRGQM